MLVLELGLVLVVLAMLVGMVRYGGVGGGCLCC